MRLGFRGFAALGFAVCAVAMAVALYLQYGRGEEPCPLCIFQRIAMILTGCVFLAAALHGPRQWGRWIYAVTAAFTASTGIGLAARHVWLQSLPPGDTPACGPSLGYLLKMLPVNQVVELVLKGDASCAAVTSTLFGVSLPIWTLILFLVLAFYAVSIPIMTGISEERVGNRRGKPC